MLKRPANVGQPPSGPPCVFAPLQPVGAGPANVRRPPSRPASRQVGAGPANVGQPPSGPPCVFAPLQPVGAGPGNVGQPPSGPPCVFAPLQPVGAGPGNVGQPPSGPPCVFAPLQPVGAGPAQVIQSPCGPIVVQGPLQPVRHRPANVRHTPTGPIVVQGPLQPVRHRPAHVRHTPSGPIVVQGPLQPVRHRPAHVRHTPSGPIVVQGPLQPVGAGPAQVRHAPCGPTVVQGPLQSVGAGPAHVRHTPSGPIVVQGPLQPVGAGPAHVRHTPSGPIVVQGPLIPVGAGPANARRPSRPPSRPVGAVPKDVGQDLINLDPNVHMPTLPLTQPANGRQNLLDIRVADFTKFLTTGSGSSAGVCRRPSLGAMPANAGQVLIDVDPIDPRARRSPPAQQRRTVRSTRRKYPRGHIRRRALHTLRRAAATKSAGGPATPAPCPLDKAGGPATPAPCPLDKAGGPAALDPCLQDKTAADQDSQRQGAAGGPAALDPCLQDKTAQNMMVAAHQSRKRRAADMMAIAVQNRQRQRTEQRRRKAGPSGSRIPTPPQVPQDRGQPLLKDDIYKFVIGEIAFQLDRRILTYIFTAGPRLYGFRVLNINEKVIQVATCEKERDEMTTRHNEIMQQLTIIGYCPNVHPKFSEDIVNTFGIFKEKPQCQVMLENYNNADYLKKTITENAPLNLVMDLLVLLNCLLNLSNSDGQPLFIW
uniref:speriolin-like isoform X4 n=1 Tax=Pristiophorus japonicus TaxID=55135 RepID=UPI00398F3D03